MGLYAGVNGQSFDIKKIYCGVNSLANAVKKGYVGIDNEARLFYEINHNNEGNYISTGVYGVEWDGSSSTKWARTDSSIIFDDPLPAVRNGAGYSPFDNILPWAGMKVVDRVGGKMVSIPKFYYKLYKIGNSMSLKITAKENAEWALSNGFHVSPAHMDRGDGKGERDVVYVGRYHCSSDDFKSLSNVSPQTNLAIAYFRMYIHNLGSTIWQWDYAMLVTIWMLYLVEFADWDSQSVIGGGVTPGVMTMGYTDSMDYHTGTNQETISSTVYGGTQYRWIEGLWDLCADFCDGISFDGQDIYLTVNPGKFGSSNAYKMLVGSRPASSSSGYLYGGIKAWNISSLSGFEWFLYPSDMDGSFNTYSADSCSYDANGVTLNVGRYSSSDWGTDERQSGLFHLNGRGAISGAHSSVGSRIMELP